MGWVWWLVATVLGYLGGVEILALLEGLYNRTVQA